MLSFLFKAWWVWVSSFPLHQWHSLVSHEAEDRKALTSGLSQDILIPIVYEEREDLSGHNTASVFEPLSSSARAVKCFSLFYLSFRWDSVVSHKTERKLVTWGLSEDRLIPVVYVGRKQLSDSTLTLGNPALCTDRSFVTVIRSGCVSVC